jgi:ribosomal protein L11 methyltransferase
MAYHELTINISEPCKDALIQRLSEWGCLGVIEQDEFLIAYFPESIDISTIINEFSIFKTLFEKAGYVPNLTFKHTLIQEQDWNESWKKGFTPLDVGEHFTILPPWERKHDNRINLIIDPGMAFGTGHHETTRSCLVLLEKYDGKCAKDRFLDLGTGTGLLAIAASKLGYKHVLAVDIDPLATEATRMNMELNKVTNVVVREGSIVEASGTFDCITANIISGVLIQLVPRIASRLKTPGIAVLSGILVEQADEVISAFQQTGMKLLEKYCDGKWVSLVVAH